MEWAPQYFDETMQAIKTWSPEEAFQVKLEESQLLVGNHYFKDLKYPFDALSSLHAKYDPTHGLTIYVNDQLFLQVIKSTEQVNELSTRVIAWKLEQQEFEALKNFQNITELSVQNPKAEDFQVINELKLLKVLQLNCYCTRTTETFNIDFKKLNKLIQLEDLQIRYYGEDAEYNIDFDCNGISQLSKLEQFSLGIFTLEGSHYPDFLAFKNLDEFKSLNSFKKLKLPDVDLNDENLENLNQLGVGVDVEPEFFDSQIISHTFNELEGIIYFDHICLYNWSFRFIVNQVKDSDLYSITTLTLKFREIYGCNLNYLSKFPNLNTLHIYYESDDFFPDISGLKQLKVLTLFNEDNDNIDFLKIIKIFSNLKNLDHFEIYSQDYDFAIDAIGIKQLQNINNYLSNSKKVNFVTTLRLDFEYLFKGDLNHLCMLPNLNTLDININWSDELFHLPEINKLKNLKSVDISVNGFSSNGLIEIHFDFISQLLSLEQFSLEINGDYDPNSLLFINLNKFNNLKK